MSDQKDRAEEAKPEVETEEPDIADEEELDIEIQRVAPKKAGGCGAWGWIIVIIILALLAVILGVRHQRLTEEAAKAKELRETSYVAQEATISDNVKTAAETAARGDMADAVKQLAAAEEKWGQMAASANSAGDTDRAQLATMKKAALAGVLAELDADRKQAAALAEQAAKLQQQAEALRKQQNALSTKVRDRILQLAGTGEEPVAEPVEM